MFRLRIALAVAWLLRLVGWVGNALNTLRSADNGPMASVPPYARERLP